MGTSLGKMLIKYMKENNIQVIKEEQKLMLIELGAEIVLNSNDVDFEKKSNDISKRLNTKCCFDAVGGDLTLKILKNMPTESIIYVYRLLSAQKNEGEKDTLIIKNIDG